VRKRDEKEWDLTIDPDTVRLFAQKARALSAAINEDYADGAEHEVELDSQSRDSHMHDGLAEEAEENLTEKELRELLGDLNVDEAAELIALVWIGRGDYDAEEWPRVVRASQERETSAAEDTASYLLGIPNLPDLLDEGLAAMGRSCAE